MKEVAIDAINIHGKNDLAEGSNNFAGYRLKNNCIGSSK